MDAIGGYFEIAKREDEVCSPHKNGILLNTGRNAFELILLSIGRVKKVYLPYYSCQVLLEPLKRLHILWEYYHINSHFEISDQIELNENEYLVAINYFGIKDSYIKQLSRVYRHHLIVDCAQAFFAEPIPGFYSFYSARKFIGVADGGVAYLEDSSDKFTNSSFEYDNTSDHDQHLYIRRNLGPEAGFQTYQSNERKLGNQPIRLMSLKTKDILSHINYESLIKIRKDNFSFLHDAVKDMNLLTLPNHDSYKCPMVYPFLPKDNKVRREDLINNRVYIAKYWPNVLPSSLYKIETFLTEQLLALPCDQRYGKDDLSRILSFLV